MRWRFRNVLLVVVLLFSTVLGAGTALFGYGAPLMFRLVATEWSVVSMDGFPEDNVVDGYFDFTLNRFRYYDGVNHASTKIRWDLTGFSVAESGASTAVLAAPGPVSHLNSFARIGSHVDVDIGEDGRLTLTRDDLAVVAESTG